jgi:hypothetical protein
MILDKSLYFLFFAILFSCNNEHHVKKDVTKHVKLYYDKNNTKIKVSVQTKLVKNEFLQHGEAKTFFENGKIQSISNLYEGKFEGDYFTFDSIGNMLTYSSYYNDKPFFTCYLNKNKIIYYSTGCILSENIEYDFGINKSPVKNFVFVAYLYVAEIPNFDFKLDSVTINNKRVKYSYKLSNGELKLNLVFKKSGINKLIVYCHEKSKKHNQKFKSFYEISLDVI